MCISSGKEYTLGLCMGIRVTDVGCAGSILNNGDTRVDPLSWQFCQNWVRYAMMRFFLNFFSTLFFYKNTKSESQPGCS